MCLLVDCSSVRQANWAWLTTSLLGWPLARVRPSFHFASHFNLTTILILVIGKLYWADIVVADVICSVIAASALHYWCEFARWVSLHHVDYLFGARTCLLFQMLLLTQDLLRRHNKCLVARLWHHMSIIDDWRLRVLKNTRHGDFASLLRGSETTPNLF